MSARWESFKLWLSQYRAEIRRASVATLLFVTAILTDRLFLAGLIAAGTAVMFLGMKFGSRYQNLGQAMIAGKARRQTMSEMDDSASGSESD